MFKNLPILFLFIVLATNGYVSAQPELDTSYNSSGMFVMSFVSTGTPSDIITQPDNKILLSGSCVANFIGYSVCIVRANENGSFDTSFGNSGYVATSISGTNAVSNVPTGLALQNDGKIVAVATVGVPSNKRVAIIRYNSNGTLDSSFGTNGIVLAVVDGNDTAHKVLIQPDGKILVLAASGASATGSQFIARYAPNGTIDSAFGINGVVRLGLTGNYFGSQIALQPDGKIVTGGTATVTRLNSDGSLDTSFDGDGIVNIAAGGNIVSVDIQSDGKILALGGNNLLHRFNTDGAVDTSFDNDGSRPALIGVDEVFDLIVTPSGKINVVGNPSIEPNFPNIFFRTARYLPNGSPDTSFSDDGLLDVNFTSFTVEGATVVSIDRQGRLVMGGRASSGSIIRAPWNTPQFATTRLLASPAQNVGFTGRVTETNGKAVANAYITLKNGTQVIGYSRTNPFGYFRFANVPSNITYTLSTVSKGLEFYDRNVLVDGAVENYWIVSK